MAEVHVSDDGEPDDSVAQSERLWRSCTLPAHMREAWLALLEAFEAATPPLARRPTDDEIATLQQAKDALDVFLAELAPDVQEELAQIMELRRRELKATRKRAEKRDKKARKAAARQAACAEQGLSANAKGDRMVTSPPTVLDDVASGTLANPLHTPAVEVDHVHRVYDSIADHWSHTRYKAWPRVEEFLRRLPPGALVADLGCGNGKNIPAVLESKGFVVASDMSEPLARIAAETHGADALVADCLRTNLRSGAFDAAISIAVLHHLSTEPRRLQALREGARILRPGGDLLVYCWSYEQDDERSKSHHRFPGQDVLVPWSFRTPGIKKLQRQVDSAKPATASEPSGADGTDVQDWQQTPEVLQRYCHVYREGELLELFGQISELEIIDSWFDTGNWCAVARRLAD